MSVFFFEFHSATAIYYFHALYDGGLSFTKIEYTSACDHIKAKEEGVELQIISGLQVDRVIMLVLHPAKLIVQQVIRVIHMQMLVSNELM